MLRGNLLQPEILQALASAGHGSKVLITDSNYPVATHSGPNASLVFLNLAPGKLSVTDVLETLLESIAIETVEVMTPGKGDEPSIFPEIRALTKLDLQLRTRSEFYEIARSEDICLVVMTGEQRTFACAILTIGVLT